MGADWPGLPTPLWNHAACAVESVPSYKLFCFGGQKAEFVYSSTVSVLDTARKVSSSTAISGTTPTPTPTPTPHPGLDPNPHPHRNAHQVWSSPAISGTPPGAREDCGVAYDTKSCNLLYFGGWRQGWLDDLCCLNVAGIVGPPYAVQSIEPATGPVTGNTPVVLRGIGFTESADVKVKPPLTLTLNPSLTLTLTPTTTPTPTPT